MERIVFKPEKASVQKKPLDGLVEKLATLREKVERDSQERPELDRCISWCVGDPQHCVARDWHLSSSSRNVTYILGIEEPAPNGYSSRREIDTDTVWYSVPAATERLSQQF
ncbi:hypothetical protein [Dictyobacter kobayashii]|uniref:Uncharacterized protein n=1 Tax=Dictyobacter kobayashii TaxID=2014872 RepID=A0A402AB66_9CHLR|nr:hypothetical protein [Dictyobacter kobayashii]GCE16201.1 hypothetical protein KDK_00010 [Dictyobacter kobayashii]